MNELLLRRRALLSASRSPMYAITAETNPEQMAVCYAQGWAANPDYMTVKEAIAAPAPHNKFTSCKLLDMTYFYNAMGEWNQIGSCKYLILPNIERLAGNNRFMSAFAIKYIEFGDKVADIGGESIVNGGGWVTDITVICHALVPPALHPRLVGLDHTQAEPKGKGPNHIYVPDEVLTVYKQDASWSQYADITHPLSEFVKPSI